MNELNTRKWHRLFGTVLCPMILIQVVTGLTLSLPFLNEIQDREYSLLMGSRMPSLAKFWRFMLVDGHTGGGIFGIWYTLLLGCGLAFIVLSGLLIFWRIRQRMRQCSASKVRLDRDGERTTADKEFPEADALPEMEQIWAINWRIYSVLVIGVLAVFLIGTYTNFIAYRIANRDTALSITAAEITLQTLLAHLEQEEILGGSRKDGMGTITNRLATADHDLLALLEGGVTSFGDLPRPDNPVFLEKFKSLRQTFLEFKERAEARGVLSSNAAQDAAIVEAYDQTFAKILDQSEEIKKLVQASFLKSLDSFRSTFALLMSINAILLVLMAIVIYRLERARILTAKKVAQAINHANSTAPGHPDDSNAH